MKRPKTTLQGNLKPPQDSLLGGFLRLAFQPFSHLDLNRSQLAGENTKGPLMCSEYYPAWFDTWGQAHHPPKSDREFFGPIDWMLEQGLIDAAVPLDDVRVNLTF